jgi:FkbM family methyltransferase
MATNALTTHHVGGRAGTRTFPILKYFEKDIVSVLYEADDSAISGIKKATHRLPSKTVILPDCLSGHAGKRNFYIYNNRYFSSLYPLKAEQTQTYSFDSQFGWDTDPKALSLVETLTLDTVTLDEVIKREKSKNIPSPDFLSLDTQGSELEILKGGKIAIQNTVVAIATEVSFTQIYERQPLFGEITNYLNEIGFDLASLETFNTESSSHRTPVGMRGKGFAQSGEALFLRKLSYYDTIEEKITSQLKQAFIAFCFEFYDQTFDILNNLSFKTIEEIVSRDTNKVNYLLFLIELKKMSDNYPKLFPVKYSDILTNEQGRTRFTSKQVNINYQNIAKNYYDEFGEKYFHEVLKTLDTPKYFGADEVAHTFDLIQQANDLRRRRLEQIRAIKRWLTLDSI